MEKTNCRYCGTHKETYSIFRVKCTKDKHIFSITRAESEELPGMYIKAGKLHYIENNKLAVNTK